MVGSPLFDKVSITRDDGSVTVIAAYNNTKENVFVQKVAVNGKTLDKPFLDHFQLADATIEFWMSNQPSKWIQE